MRLLRRLPQIKILRSVQITIKEQQNIINWVLIIYRLNCLQIYKSTISTGLLLSYTLSRQPAPMVFCCLAK